MLAGSMLIHAATLPRKAIRVKPMLNLKEHSRRRLQSLLNAFEERNRFAAIEIGRAHV